MTLSTVCGVFGKTSSTSNGATQDVTLSFTPKAVIVWTSGCLAIGNTNGTVYNSHGVSDGTTNKSIMNTCGDNLATSEEDRKWNTSNCIGIINNAGATQLLASITFASNKFTVTWDTNVAGWTDLQVHYMAYGGDDIACEVISFATATATGVQSIATSAPTQNAMAGRAVIFFGGFNVNSGTATTDNCFDIGVTDGTNEGTAGFAGDNGSAALEHDCMCNDAKCITITNAQSAVVDGEADFSAFTSSGFDINWSDAPAGARLVWVLIIKGGKWQVGNSTGKTSTGTQAYTTTFLPKSVLMISTNRTANGVTEQDTSFAISGTDGTNETSCGHTADDASDPTQVSPWSSNTKAIRICDVGATSATNGEADFSSFNATDFTLNWNDGCSSAWKFTWVVCGDSNVMTGCYKQKTPFWEIEGTDEDEVIG